MIRARKSTEEALAAVAGSLGIRRSSLELIAGAANRLETIAVEGIDPADLRKLVSERLGDLG